MRMKVLVLILILMKNLQIYEDNSKASKVTLNSLALTATSFNFIFEKEQNCKKESQEKVIYQENQIYIVQQVPFWITLV